VCNQLETPGREGAGVADLTDKRDHPFAMHAGDSLAFLNRSIASTSIATSAPAAVWARVSAAAILAAVIPSRARNGSGFRNVRTIGSGREIAAAGWIEVFAQVSSVEHRMR
jgi:hypothetical protein